MKIFGKSHFIILAMLGGPWHPAWAAAKEKFIPSRFSAHFQQSFVSSLSGKDKSSSGIIKYLYPGHLWFEVMEPEKDKTLFISNTKKSWFYTPAFDENEKGEVVIQPSNKLLLASFFDSLRSGLVDNELYAVKAAKDKSAKGAQGKDFEVTFNKRPSSEIGVLKALLRFKSSEPPSLEALNSMTLSYADGREVTISFSGFKVEDASVKEGDFEFKITDKVRVVEKK